MSERLTLSDLTCDWLNDPLGIESPRPRLGWKLRCDRRGARQAAYQLLVAGNENDLVAGRADLWDSGQIRSDQSVQVLYEGCQLGSRQRAWWKVRIWDELGESWDSPSAWWEMGLLDRGDWLARWIGGTLVGGVNTSVPTPFLRRAFVVTKPVETARLYATALGLYECELNGVRAGNHVFAPGWTDYKKRLHYQTLDVTSLVQGGENVWGAVLGDGWAAGYVGWFGRQHYIDSPRFFSQLEIKYTDGSVEVITTDEQWRVTYGPILQADLIRGEHFDARLDFPGWSAPGFDDADWLPVRIFASIEAQICAPLAPPVRRIEELRPVRAPHQSGSAWIFDFGQNIAGRVRLQVNGPRGATIKLRFAECLEGGPLAVGGPIYTANLRAASQTDIYTLRGGGDEEWEPRFTCHGFRFLEVSGYPGSPRAEHFTAIVLHSDNARIGDFECSDPLINQLQKNIDWSWRGNSVDLPTDCPQRDERLGWTGDAQVFVRTAAFNRDVSSFFSEWARDCRDAQSSVGAVPCTVPDVGIFGQDPSPIARPGDVIDGGPAWSNAVIICPWTVYRTTGDTKILEENYDSFQLYLGYLEATARDYILFCLYPKHFGGFGDWLALDGSGATGGGTPYELIGTAFFAHSADLLSRIARVLGKMDDAQRYAELFGKIKVAFCRQFVTSAGLMSPPYQTPYLLALQFNLVPVEQRSQLVENLEAAICQRGGKLSTGFVGSPYLNHVLTREGKVPLAYELLHQTGWPSWLYAVTQGATTIWERWDGWTKEKGFQDVTMNSFNHYAYGAIGAWLYQVVAGIELDEEVAGYKRFLLRPTPGGGLTSARAHIDCVYGRIESAWRLDGPTFHWDITVPPNTTATAVIPSVEDEPVFEGSSEAHTAASVKFLRREGGYAFYEVDPGSYRFRSKFENRS